jgi:DMSO/TMAO reductase YedYZ molybdopterin-dependent catalytic subunit
MRLYDSADTPYLRSMKIDASLRWSLIGTFALTLICAAVASAQSVPPSSSATDVLLVVGGEVEHPLKLTRADLAKFKRQSVQAKDHDGKEGKYNGVALGDILKAAGVKFGEQLRGKALATYLLVEAADGYRAVYALPEVDPEMTERLILVADERDGKPLPAASGPLQIITPGDKQHSRWVRQVRSLTIQRAPSTR